MLTSLSLENFKSWARIDAMRLAPITALFGPNSSGKSGILQFLLLLKQTKESTDRAAVLNLGDADSYANLGTFKDLIHRHDESKKLTWALHWRRDQSLIIPDPETRRRTRLFEGNEFAVSSTISLKEKGRMSTERVQYKFGGSSFSLEPKPSAPSAYRLTVDSAQPFKFVRTQGRPWELPGPTKFYGFPDQVQTYFQNSGFLAELQLEFEKRIDRIYYLGPLREFPRREYLWGGGRPLDVGRRGERTVDAILAARASKDTIGRGKGKKRISLEQYVAEWLRKLDLIADFRVEEIADESNLYRVLVRRSADSAETMITDVGFGVSQVLPVVVLLYYVPEGSTVVLEQPEIHLHPSVQSALADMFIDAVRVRRLQIIAESHSEHLLRRLQRRIAEEEIFKDQSAFYFCEMRDGASRLVPLDVDEYGNIGNWPKDFFGDEFGEMAEMTKASLKRKQKAAE